MKVAGYATPPQRGIGAGEIKAALSHEVLDYLTQIDCHTRRDAKSEIHPHVIERVGHYGPHFILERVGRVGIIYMYHPVVVGAFGLLVDYRIDDFALDSAVGRRA